MRADRNNENSQTVSDIIKKLDENVVEHRRSGEKNARTKSTKSIVIKSIAAVFVFAAVVYTGIGYIKYNGKFLPGTVINGTDFSGMSVEEVCDYYENKINNYTLDIIHDTYVIDKITPDKISLELSWKAKWYFASLVKKQANIMWLPAILGKEDVYEMDYMDIMTYNVHQLNFFIADSVGYNLPVTIESRQGSIFYNGNNFEIVPPVQSDQIDPATYIQRVYSAVQSLSAEMVIEESDCYVKNEMTPEIEEKLNEACEVAENFFNSKNMNISLKDYDYDFNSEIINAIYNITADYNFICNETTIDNGIDVISDRYNDIGKEISFQTSHGTTVTVEGGDYGTYMDTKSLRKAVKAAILDNEDVDEVINLKTNTLDGVIGEIGDTYVEIDLTNQYLYMYVDGELIRDCPVVTGLPGSRATPQGVYRLKSKAMNVTLVGADYRTPVKYWMPFNGGIGMHDATWQSYYGGDTYLTNGSHGCINMAISDAAVVYENAIINMPVICYYHDRIDVFQPISTYERNGA